jgi:GH24 family phage-related lysozyme (muramidase)
MGNNPVSNIDPDGGLSGPGDGCVDGDTWNDGTNSWTNVGGTWFDDSVKGPVVWNNYHRPSSSIDGGMPRMSFPIIMNGGNNNSISIKGIAFLAQREGTILHPYNDSKGFATVGIGHLIAKRNVNSQDKLDWAWLNTGEEAKVLFNKDLKTVYEPAINKMVKVKLTPYQYDAIVSFTYNVGVHGLKISKFLSELNKGNYNGELMLNFHRPSSIIGRRVKEVNLFNNGQY